MAIQTQTFDQLVSSMVSTVQGLASQLVDLTVGSILRAKVEAVAAIALWLQGVAVTVTSLTRLSSSSGEDADTFCADYGFFRLPSQPATGPVVLSRYTPSAQAVIQAAIANGVDSYGRTIWIDGSIVQTQDGTQQYQVIPDTTQAAYNATLNQYVVAASVNSGTVTVQAVTPGAASNAAAGMINSLGSAIPGIDTVANSVGFTNGEDAELDPAFKARFVDYIKSLAEATPGAVGAAVESVQQDISYSIVENENFDGSPNPGFFYVIVDDGTGNPSSNFLATVANAVDAVRPLGSTFSVIGPSLVRASVTMTLTTAPGYNHATLVAQVNAAVTAYINALAIGQSLNFSRLPQVAYDVSPGVTNVFGTVLNGSTQDLPATSVQIIKAFAIIVA